MMRKVFFYVLLIALSVNSKPLFAVEKSNFIEVSNDSIIKEEILSKVLSTRDFLFIENGKSYFHILLRNGFLTGPFQEHEFVYKDYSSPVPNEINVELQALVPTKMALTLIFYTLVAGCYSSLMKAVEK